MINPSIIRTDSEGGYYGSIYLVTVVCLDRFAILAVCECEVSANGWEYLLAKVGLECGLSLAEPQLG